MRFSGGSLTALSLTQVQLVRALVNVGQEVSVEMDIELCDFNAMHDTEAAAAAEELAAAAEEEQASVPRLQVRSRAGVVASRAAPWVKPRPDVGCWMLDVGCWMLGVGFACGCWWLSIVPWIASDR
jgi:hypothetical protein